LLSQVVGWQARTNGHVEPGARTVGPNTVKRELANLKSLFRWAIAEGKLRRRDNPLDGITCKGGDPASKARPTVEQADQLVALPVPATVDLDSWCLLPVLARYTGARIGELAMLEAENVVVEQGIRCFHIRPTEEHRLKTRSSERVVPIADKLAPHVDALLTKHPSGPLFPGCRHWRGSGGVLKPAHYLLKVWNRHAKTVGPFSFHCLRLYANDELVRGETDITDRERILGHKSGRTQAAYTARELARYLKALNKIR